MVIKIKIEKKKTGGGIVSILTIHYNLKRDVLPIDREDVKERTRFEEVTLKKQNGYLTRYLKEVEGLTYVPRDESELWGENKYCGLESNSTINTMRIRTRNSGLGLKLMIESKKLFPETTIEDLFEVGAFYNFLLTGEHPKEKKE